MTDNLLRFAIPLLPLQTLDELLPARLVVPKGLALLLAARALEAGKAMLVLPLPFERYEVRAREQGWLELEAARL